MPKSKLLHTVTCLATLFSLTSCSSDKTSSVCNAGDPGCATGAGGTSSTATKTTTAGATSVGGSSAKSSSTGGSSTTGGTSAKTSSSSVGGGSATGGSSAKSSAAGGSSATGGSSAKSSAAGGSSATGGSSAKSSAAGGSSATGGSSAKTSTATGGTSAATGGTSTKTTTGAGGTTTATGGTSAATGGITATGGATADQSGVPLAKAGDKTTTSKDYLNVGEIRLINNRWGSDELGCNSTLNVSVNTDKSLGWTFTRGNCGDEYGAKPDFPELEFGINPFGATSSLRTSPAFSSTTLLPRQIKDITSASLNIDSMTTNITSDRNNSRWDTCFEFWLSQKDPVTGDPAGVYAELILFLNWNDNTLFWGCDPAGPGTDADHNKSPTAAYNPVSAGDKSYKLCHYRDNWASGQWRYYQLLLNGGQSPTFNGKIDVKVLLKWLQDNYNLPGDLWLTRMEVGTEYADNTSGNVSIKNISFEVNSETRSKVLAP